MARYFRVFLVAIFSISIGFAYAESGHEHDHDHEVAANGKEAFNAGEMIMHHIGDSHDWHILDLTNEDGSKHPISVPLPVIIYHKENGLSVFMSSAFHHGTEDHEGYRLDHGHIVAVDAEGHEDEASTAQIIDLSITKNVAAMMFSIFLMLFIFLKVAKTYKTRGVVAPTGLQNMIETIIVFIRDDLAKSSIGPKYEKFMPFLLTIFFFIWINNILGLVPLIPGGANVTGNIAIPLVLALFTFVITNINGNKNYWKHIIAMPGVPKPVLLILTPIEFLQIFIRPIVLVIRLFANITAGHISMLVFFSLIFIFQEKSNVAGWGVSVASVAFTIFLNVLELLVGAIQAYVFTLLSAVYFGMAVAEDHH